MSQVKWCVNTLGRQHSTSSGDRFELEPICNPGRSNLVRLKSRLEVLKWMGLAMDSAVPSLSLWDLWVEKLRNFRITLSLSDKPLVFNILFRWCKDLPNNCIKILFCNNSKEQELQAMFWHYLYFDCFIKTYYIYV